MTEYNAPSLDEGTDGSLTPRNDSFPFRSDESIDGLFAVSYTHLTLPTSDLV